MQNIDPAIITISLAAAAVAKILVDMVRMTNRLPAWVSPPLSVAFGIGAAFLLLLANGTVLTGQTAAQAAIAGILAAGTAIGSTELQKREKSDPEYIHGVAGTLHLTDEPGLIEEPGA